MVPLLRTFLLAPLAVFLILAACPVVAGAAATTHASEGASSHGNVETQDNPPVPEASGRPVRELKELPRNILRDQKFLWLRAFRLKRADVPWAGVIFGTTAGLIALDRPVGQELSDSPPGAGFAFSRRVGQFGGGLTDFGVAGAFYLVGRWRGDERARTTGLLSFQAVADSLIVVQILKTASQRPRPTRADGRLRNHNADGEFFTGGRSFPSGHAAHAWALATVVAHQYRHRRWVPPTAYGLAGLVAVARVTQRKHFPSDIFVGSVLGYLIGRHVSHAAQRGPADIPLRWHLLPYGPPSGGVALTFAWEF
ncbi:MAG: phosphatase PAP2 family protein [Terriglobia bacterium]